MIRAVGAVDAGKGLEKFDDMTLEHAITVQEDLAKGARGERGAMAQEARDAAKRRAKLFGNELKRREEAGVEDAGPKWVRGPA